MKPKFASLCVLICPGLVAMNAAGQAVNVTVTLGTNSIAAGGSTTLHVFAQVVPAQRANSERIFSWYLDVLNTNGAAASANYSAMVKPASDNDPLGSSKGAQDGANRRNIYDTFFNLPGAGVSTPVELMSIPITGLSAGQTRFRIQAGSGGSMSSDFLVAPIGGGTPLTGGSYSQADVVLTVTGSLVIPSTSVSISVTNASGGAKGVTLSFPTNPGFDHTAQFRNQLNGGTGWQPLPGAPHNSGKAFDLSTNKIRFYRIAIAPAN
jgi:hypothetical protein